MSKRLDEITLEELEIWMDAYKASNMSQREFAEQSGISARSLGRRIERYELLTGQKAERLADRSRTQPFEIDSELFDDVADLDDIKERRRKEFDRKHKAKTSRKLISCKVKIDGPIGILHMGDNHVDDPGTDISLLERHVELVKETEGLFGANVGDMANHWVGRLARLHAYQTTTEAETWKLVEWLMTSIDWLYIIGGNHDLWVGNGDPINWMVRGQSGVYEAHGARIGLKFPNGSQVVINARHDWPGHSMWNSAHGPSKAVQKGVTDHIVIAGHKHVSGYSILKNPLSGRISHALRVGSYKVYDDYADALGLSDGRISSAVLTIIDPYKEDTDPGMVNVFHDIESGVDFLKFLRARHSGVL